MKGGRRAIDRREPATVALVRGGAVESGHAVHAVVTEAAGSETAAGDPSLGTFWRSAMKPFQALPLLEDGAVEALGITEEELALCCASHAGTDRHIERVASLLERAGLDEEALFCAPHPPFDGEAARAVLRGGGEFGRVHNNCSGKHAGMLALARHRGWPIEGYHRRTHPVQQRIRRALERWLDADPGRLPWARDGCGVPTPRLTLRAMAAAYARLGRASAEERDGPAAAVVGAMTAHPDLVSGGGRLATRVMEESGGRIVAKEGAEGVVCAAAPAEGWGLALKVEDGARRAVGPALVALMEEWELLTGSEVDGLSELGRPPVRDRQGEEVGVLEARLPPDVASRTAKSAPGEAAS